MNCADNLEVKKISSGNTNVQFYKFAQCVSAVSEYIYTAHDFSFPFF